MTTDIQDATTELGQLVLSSGTEEYARSRSIYNARTAHAQPAAIARPQSVEDVLSVVRYAAERELPLALRSGGHGVDGTAMPHGALVLDLTAFKQISVDHDTKRVRLGAGVLLGEMDTQLIQHELAVPAGTVSTTGVTGLTLGGGVGFNMRKWGATVDNLISCELVTTDARIVRASQDENPDLFWALRGGGGNFGIVTALEFQGRPMQPTIAAGMIPYTFDQAPDVLRAVREFMLTAPRELGIIVSVVKCPPLPPIPAEVHGKEVVMFVVAYTGPVEQADTVINQLAACGTPAAIAVNPVPWPVANSMIDALAPSGRRVYTKGAYLADLSDEVAKITLEHEASAPPATAWPTPSSVQELWSLSGAIAEDFSEDSCAFSREGASWFWEGASFWEDPAADGQYMSWVDSVYTGVKQHARANCYINLTTDIGPQWRRGAWGSADKYRRLVAAKAKWDPSNMLRYNKNIPPDDTV